MIDKKDIIDFDIMINNNITHCQMIGSNQIYNIPGQIEIKFSMKLRNESKDFSDLMMTMNNQKKINIETTRGNLIDCLITSFDCSIGFMDTVTEMKIEGIARKFDEIIEVIFKDCVKKVKASVYNSVINIIGADITYEEYARQALVEEI
jgi:copper chaperone CopZ